MTFRLAILCCLILLHLESVGQVNYFNLGLDRNLPSLSVFGICEDAQGRIWLGTDDGLAYLLDGQLHRLYDSIIPNTVLRIYPSPSGGLYIIGNNPSVIIKKNLNGTVIPLFSQQNTRFNGVLCAYNLFEDCIYFSNWNFIFRLKGSQLDTVCPVKGNGLLSMESCIKEGVFINHKDGLYKLENNELVKKSTFSASAVMPLSKNSIVLFGDHEVSTISGDLQSVHSYEGQLSSPPYHATLVDMDIWFTGLLNGLYSYSEKGLTNVVQDLPEFKNTQFTSIFNDSRGNVWCGTNGNGVYIFPNYQFITRSTESDLLSNEGIKKISHISEDSTYVLTKDALYLYDNLRLVSRLDLDVGSKNMDKTIYHDVLKVKNRIVVSSTSISGRRSLTESPHQNILNIFGTGVILYRGRLFTGGHRKLTVITKQQIKDKVVINDLSYPNYEGNFGKITSFFVSDTSLLFSADGGVYSFSEEKQKVSKLGVGEKKSEYFLDVIANSKNQLFALTGNTIYGLIKERWKPLYTSKVFGSYRFTCLDIDADNRLWIGTDNGVLVLKEGLSTRITTVNGLISNDVLGLEINKHTNTAWISTSKGLLAFDINNNTLGDKFPFKLDIEKIELLDGRQFIDGNYHLKSNENSFKVYFEIKNYFQLSKPEFRYRLSQSGAEWTYTKDYSVRFLALSPGDYQLEIQAQSPGYSWSTPIRRSIVISLPIWQSWQFYLVAFLFLIIVIVGIYYVRLSQIRKNADKKRETIAKLNELELQALNANMNPHFIFNSLNSIQHYILPLKNTAAINYISNLSKLIRLNMNAVGKKLVSLEGELVRTRLYVNLEKERIDKPLLYEEHILVENEAAQLWLPSMIIQPAIENSIWHGIQPSNLPGTINLAVIQEDKDLHIRLEDNGIGLQKALANKHANHTSKGINLTRQRVQLLHPENTYEIDELRTIDGDVLGTVVAMKIRVGITG